jgi:hypothetical protein
VPVLERHPEAGAVYSQVYYSSRSRVGQEYPALSRARSGWIFESLLMGNFMTVHSVLVRREAFEKTGYFDERLSSYEDWDMWLRLSFHFPFLFLPGAVAVYNVSPDGLWLGTRREAEEERCTRVIEKAVQMLPESRAYAGLRRAAKGRVALAYAATWTKELAALHAHPGILRYSWARRYVRQWVCKQALDSESPVSTAQALCAQAKGATPPGGVWRRWWLRSMLAGVWAEIARSLASGSQLGERAAAYAALRAVAQRPSYVMQMTLARIIFRGLLSLARDAAAFRRVTS